MSDSKPYLIKLRPLGNFFFGGEKNFGGMENESYLIESRLFPQQTTILGMLRMQILRAYDLLDNPFSGNKIENKSLAESAIGKTGFQVNGSSDFGVIKAVSPVFIADENEFFFVGPKDLDFNYIEEALGKHALVSPKKNQIEFAFLPKLDNYNAKDYYPPKFISNKNSIKNKKDIFVARQQIGITKNAKHFPHISKFFKEKEADEGFFKQTCYQLGGDYSFAFLIWLEKNAGEKLAAFLSKNDKIWMGGEKSAFRMEMKSWEEDISEIGPGMANPVKDRYKILLLSDAFVKPTIYKHCQFSFGENIEFRFLKSNLEKTDHYYRRTKNGGGADDVLQRSSKYHLLERGSVFYLLPDQLEAFRGEMEAPDSFRKIGYNAFLITNQNQSVNFYKPK